MENYEQINEMKDFISGNIVFHSISPDGDIIQKTKNGKTRIVNAISKKVELLDNEGKILYSKILDESHPLIYYAKKRYNHHYVDIKPKKFNILALLIDELGEEDPERIKYKKYEEYYKVI